MFLLRVKRAGTGATDFVGRQNYGGKNMEANKVKFLCEKYAKEVIPDSRKSFADRLAEAPDAAFEPLVNVKLKSQTAALLLSIAYLRDNRISIARGRGGKKLESTRLPLRFPSDAGTTHQKEAPH